LYQCQYVGANLNLFVGGLAVGAPGTIPFHMTSPLSPLGSCPAHPDGPIAGGSQLSDITTNPFASGSSGTPSGSSDTVTADPESDSCPPDPATPSPTPTANDRAASPTSATSMTTPAAAPPSGGFQLANGQAAQQLNAQFTTLTPNSSCTGMYLCSSTKYNTTFNFSLFLTQPVKTLASMAILPNVTMENSS
jgi:hypothetical protein